MSDRVTIVTVMKDEGPFILEWIAWNQMIGIDHFIVLTNDCSDGTDEILDRLDDLGIVTHLPNPWGLFSQRSPHGIALKYAPQLKAYKRSDWIFHTDVDEFLSIKAGRGSIQDLIAAAGHPDAISIGECLIGASGVEHYEDCLLTARFQHGMRQEPEGDQELRRGVKTLVRNSDVWRNRKNHRPVVRWSERNKISWTDGSGQPVPEEFKNGKEPGLDCTGRYDLAVLYHYSVRSMESYLAKLRRGDAVKSERTQGYKYWKKRNQNSVLYTDNAARQPELQKQLQVLRADSILEQLHTAACRHHEKVIQTALQDPEMEEMVALLRSTLWGDPKFQG